MGQADKEVERQIVEPAREQQRRDGRKALSPHQGRSNSPLRARDDERKRRRRAAACAVGAWTIQ
jgi:hypothetical protein